MRSKIPLLFLLPVVLVASIRAWRLYGRLPLDRTCEALVDVPPLPPQLRDPDGCLWLVNNLLPVVPPRTLRPCFKRSLLLLDLWSRCGLEPQLHLGLRGSADRREGHAWVTAADQPDLSASETGYTEAFVWEGSGT